MECGRDDVHPSFCIQSRIAGTSSGGYLFLQQLERQSPGSGGREGLSLLAQGSVEWFHNKVLIPKEWRKGRDSNPRWE
jgi:hypothetical protein